MCNTAWHDVSHTVNPSDGISRRAGSPRLAGVAVAVMGLMTQAGPWTFAALSEPSPLVEHTVELMVPVPPMVLDVDGELRLVYELHVTNLRREPVEVRQVSLLDAGNRVVVDVRGEALLRSTLQPGSSTNLARRTTIDPGRRAVVYFWLPWPALRPAVLNHQVTLRLRQSEVVVPGPLVTTSSQATTVIDPPLAGGPWVAVYDPFLLGGHRTTLIAVDGTARIPARFAIDWIRVPEGNDEESRMPNQAPYWNGVGLNVLAVADAVVVRAVDGQPDLPLGAMRPSRPVSLAEGSGNHVILDLGRGRFAVFEHLQQSSLRVRVGERVRRGQVMARLGSSGSTSIGPHLHFHVADSGAALTAEGAPFLLRRFTLLGRYESLDALLRGDAWTPEPRPEERREQHPSAGAVLRF